MSRTRARQKSYSLADIRIDTLNEDIVQLFVHGVEEKQSAIIANHNMHSFYLWRREPKMREFFSLADHVYIDGMLLILLGRLAGLPLRQSDRAAYIDFFPDLLNEAANRNWRIFFLGSDRGVAETAAETFRARCPQLQIRTHHGHFDATQAGLENQQVLAEIREYAPHVLLVGMGNPRQEIWILENMGEIEANVIAPCGAIMDYFAGVKRTPPRWLGALYLEGVYRLFTEPARLWRRYLVEPWFVVSHMIWQYLRNGRRAVAEELSRNE